MRAITLWQPWASLIAAGGKKYETRSWETNYRGPIAIHASKKTVSSILDEIFGWKASDERKAFVQKVREITRIGVIYDLPRGAVIATAKLIGCYEIKACTSTCGPGYGYVNIPEKIISPNSDEYLFGGWTPGRFAWEFSGVTILPEPIPAKGRQGLWTLSEAI